MGDLHDGRDTQVARAAFGPTKLYGMKTRAMGEVFLREALLFAVGADVRADVVPGLHG